MTPTYCRPELYHPDLPRQVVAAADGYEAGGLTTPHPHWFRGNAAYLNTTAAHVRYALRGVRFGSVLDVGCGAGQLYPYLPGVAYTGVDCNPAFLAEARRRCPVEVSFFEGRVEHLPFADGEFDVAVAVDVLIHVADPVVAFKELARVAERAVVLRLRSGDPTRKEGGRRRLVYDPERGRLCSGPHVDNGRDYWFLYNVFGGEDLAVLEGAGGMKLTCMTDYRDPRAGKIGKTVATFTRWKV